MTLGIDEVGRGCWAGPVVAGAVILRSPIPGLKDSKKLSKSARERLSRQVTAEARSYGLGWVSPQEVDALGLTAAVGLAMRRAVDELTVPVREIDEIIIDGSYNFFPELLKARPVVRADDLFPAVSAASIIAKVARDEYMEKLEPTYPGYGFASHVGYGTAHHKAVLYMHGVTAIHRLSYKPIKQLLAESERSVYAAN